MTGTGSTVGALKTGGYVYAVFIFEYLQIPSHQFTILGILMVIDFIAGISKQATIDPKGITSHRAWVGILKKAWTLISVIVLALILSGIGLGDYKRYMIGFLSLLIMAEGYSVIQNIYVIRTGKNVEEYDVISLIIKKVGDTIIEAIEKTLKK